MQEVQTKHYFSYLYSAMEKHWEQAVLTDYECETEYTYASLAEQIVRLKVLFEDLEIKKGEKIAICAKSSSNWAATFLAITAAERVVVSILPDYAPEDIRMMLDHSDSRLLFMDKHVGQHLDSELLNADLTVLSLHDFSIIKATAEARKKIEQWENHFSALYPNGVSLSNLHFPTDNLEQLAMLNYTSGTTGSPKGVMISYRNLSSNVTFGQTVFPSFEGENILSILPLAHIFGLMYEFLYQIAGGIHIYFLTKSPTPTVLLKAFHDVKPYMMMSVPLVMEKIVGKKVIPAIKKFPINILWKTPLICKLVENKIRKELLNAFGGRLQFVIIGGAAFNEEAELLLKRVKFPYTCGYGMTECAPLISYTDWHFYKVRSVGQIVHRMNIKASTDSNHSSEILVKGENVMMGYYKNEEATKQVFTKDGWFRTGDMGHIDSNGNIFISGRCKTMILGASGQNIYPEEIETKISTIKGVAENIVVEREGKIVALIYPEPWVLKNESWKSSALRSINKRLPNYCQISAIEIMEKEFKKTPKQSIKRTLYH